MQMKKAGAVAAGALATVAIMGAPAAAAAGAGAAAPIEAAALTMAPLQDAGPASQFGAAWFAPARYEAGSWDAPWEVDPFGLISTQGGSALLTSTIQVCGAYVTTTGSITVSAPSPNTVIGDCANANVEIVKLGPKAATSVSDNAAINAAPWQFCGSTAAAGASENDLILESANTVIGNCLNANAIIS